MTLPRLRIRLHCRQSLAGLLTLLAVVAGCKSKDGGNAATTKPRDPLVFGPSRIPQQNLPVPERGGVGSKGKTDPLIGSPTGRPGDKAGVGYSDDPERFKGTYIPSPSSTPAALAGKLRESGELKIADGSSSVPLQPVGGTVPAAGEDPATGVDALLAELEKYGVQREDRTLLREEGRYVFRATVPINGDGARRQYEGLGATAYEAVKGVLDNVIADRK